MANRQKYAEWLVSNEDKKGTPEFEKVKQAYIAASQPELVAGGPEGDAARARNATQRLGLDAQIVTPQRNPKIPGVLSLPFTTYQKGTVVPFSDRLLASFATSDEKKKKYYESEYGEGSYVQLPDGNALVKITGKDGSPSYVLENPKGIDSEDLAGAMSMAPEIIAGGLTAAKAVPGPSAGIARLAGAAGLGALAGQAVGAGQDYIFDKFILDEDPDIGEISKRRGVEAGVETVLGAGIPKVGGMIADSRVGSRAVKAIRQELNSASEGMMKRFRGIQTAEEIPGRVASEYPPNITASQAGESIAGSMADLDRRLRGSSSRLANKAAGDVSASAKRELGKVFSETVSPTDISSAASGGAQAFIDKSKTKVADLYNKAYLEIANAAGDNKFIINLKATNNAIKETLEGLPRTADGNSSFFEPLARMQQELGAVADTPQSLEAARNIRSMIGERLNGGGGVFEKMPEKTASKLYATLSKDIDNSVAAYSGEGALALKEANAAYKSLVEPFEKNRVLNRLAKEKGGFENDEFISALVSGGVDDWKAVSSVLGANTMRKVRKAAIQDITRGAEVDVGGQALMDVTAVSNRLKSMDPELKDQMFGETKIWKSLETLGGVFKKTQNKLFSKATLPTLAEAQEAMDLATNGQHGAASGALRRAYRAVQARRDNISSSIASQIKSGNTSIATDNPELFLDNLILNPSTSARTVKQVLGRIPKDTREDVADAAYRHILEKTKDSASRAVNDVGAGHSPDRLAQIVYGTPERTAVMKEVLGVERFQTIDRYVRYMAALERDAMTRTSGGRKVAGLIATLPYQNLFAARATSMALEKASTKSLLARKSPDLIRKLAKARQMNEARGLSIGSAVGAQAAINLDGVSSSDYDKYMDMLNGLSDQEKVALEDYLTNP